jgi:hypothetical protein
MSPAIRRPLTSVLCSFAVVAATIAWTAAVYLSTWADPATLGRVTEAVLDDPAARDEVVEPLRDRLVGDVDLSAEALHVDAALAVVLDDPRVREEIADAFAPADGGGRVDPAAARDAFDAALGHVDPSIAARLEELGPELALPDLSAVASLRTTAQRWVWRTAALAVVLFAAAFALGDRAMAARRYAWWAIGTGLMWWLGPILLAAGARRWLGSFDATAGVVVDAYVAPVRPWAIALTASGVAAGLVAVAALATRSRVAAPAEAAPVRDTADGELDVWAAYAVPAPVRQEPLAPR